MTCDEKDKIIAYCDNHKLDLIRKRARWIYEAYSDGDEPLSQDDAFVFAALAVAGMLPKFSDDEHAGEEYFQ